MGVWWYGGRAVWWYGGIDKTREAGYKTPQISVDREGSRLLDCGAFNGPTHLHTLFFWPI